MDYKGRLLGYTINGSKKMLCDNCAEDIYLLESMEKNNTISVGYVCAECGKKYFRGYEQLN